MVKIVIENLAQKEVYSNEVGASVLKIFQSNYIDWMHACGGKGRCTTCKMIVLEGATHLSTPSIAEEGYRKKGELADGERLACQTYASDYCKVRVPDENKLPHLDYTA
jgi:ferredoxin, 2Fe-2S